MTTVKVGTTFRSIIGDCDAEWRVVGERGWGAYDCVVTDETPEYSGNRKVFGVEEIENAVSYSAAIEGLVTMKFNPWILLGIKWGGYSASQDQIPIYVLKGIDLRLDHYQIGYYFNLAFDVVELWQSIFCSNNVADFSTSPRDCYPVNEYNVKNLIADWINYYEEEWEEFTYPPRLEWALKHGRSFPLSKEDETLFKITS